MKAGTCQRQKGGAGAAVAAHGDPGPVPPPTATDRGPAAAALAPATVADTIAPRLPCRARDGATPCILALFKDRGRRAPGPRSAVRHRVDGPAGRQPRHGHRPFPGLRDGRPSGVRAVPPAPDRSPRSLRARANRRRSARPPLPLAAIAARHRRAMAAGAPPYLKLLVMMNILLKKPRRPRNRGLLLAVRNEGGRPPRPVVSASRKGWPAAPLRQAQTNHAEGFCPHRA
jgi:hypothetical protein